MGFRYSLSLLLLLSTLSLQSKGDACGSVLFLDSPYHRYINPDAASETDGVSIVEVGAAVSVLLGFAPPATLSAASSSKLNKVLKPNPFDRPRAIFMLDVRGAEGFENTMPLGKASFGSAHKSLTIVDSEKADIQLPVENEVSVISLNELSSDSHAEFGAKDLGDFASWLGQPYVTNAFEPLNGKLTISLPSGGHLTLDVSKESDKVFLEKLVSLMHNIEKAMDMHQDFSKSIHNPAELVTGSFDGIKVLQEEYGTNGVSQMGLELLSITVSKLFETLQAAYKGQIVGVILLNKTPSPESERLLNIMYTSRPSTRSLEETQGSSDITKAIAVLLVRRTLAWTTGIILLVATLLGIYFLLYMPITKDTLLYSNVKLD